MEAVKAVRVFTRQRKRNPDVNRPPKQAVIITLDDIQARVDMPLDAAALSLGISVTTLKKACRLLGVGKWPYTRRGTSYSKSLSKRRKKEAPPSCPACESPLSFLDTMYPLWDAKLWEPDCVVPEVPHEGCDLWFLACECNPRCETLCDITSGPDVHPSLWV